MQRLTVNLNIEQKQSGLPSKLCMTLNTKTNEKLLPLGQAAKLLFNGHIWSWSVIKACNQICFVFLESSEGDFFRMT